MNTIQSIIAEAESNTDSQAAAMGWLAQKVLTLETAIKLSNSKCDAVLHDLKLINLFVDRQVDKTL